MSSWVGGVVKVSIRRPLAVSPRVQISDVLGSAPLVRLRIGGYLDRGRLSWPADAIAHGSAIPAGLILLAYLTKVVALPHALNRRLSGGHSHNTKHRSRHQ
ncbi:hypothetical protein [Arthrobacter sp. 18067]|uniref:hypothetical protein n=1 Tax=Arthrobacter sp. 18067 TaxID=2681413 RepID=UPI001359C80F|nr:hypothetical protein [Arthrobacter sp. 18067]